MSSPFNAIVRREFSASWSTPVAYVFLVVFLLLAGFFTFAFGGFFERGEASLAAFFAWLPWLFLFIVPAIGMRLWADEHRLGTLELLMTLPVKLSDAVLGKFLAAWVLCGAALLLTFPIWITVNYLGDPDNGVIVAAYLGSWLMAGSFLAIGSCMSAMTRNSVIAFILTVAICFVFVASGSEIVLSAFDWAPQILVDAVAALSFLTHFDSISKGVLDLRDILFVLVFMAAWLFASAIVIEIKKAN
jgi:ABC-2 type transport system permease protein